MVAARVIAVVAVIAAVVIVAATTVAVAAAITVVGVTTVARVGVVGAALVGTSIGMAAMIARGTVAVIARIILRIVTTEIMTMIEITITTATGIANITANTSINEIEIVMNVIAFITARASINPRIMAAMVIARTLTSVVMKMACALARRMRGGGKATSQSVHTFISMARRASSPCSAAAVHTNKLIETASCAVMKKVISITKTTSPADTFIASDSCLNSQR
jgi:hypothetical protein